MSPKSNRFLALLPSGLSFVRGALSFLIFYLIFQSSIALHYLAIFLFIAGSLTDYFDGYLARRFGAESDFGRILDPLMDKIFILTILAAFAILGFYSPWWLVPIFIREILITFCRTSWFLDGCALGAEKMGKLKLGFQVALASIGFLLLMAHDYHSAGMKAWLTPLLYILLFITLGLTIISGYQFIRSNRSLLLTPAFSRFASAAGVGVLPGAPGTWGSFVGLGLVLLCSWNIFLHTAVLALMLWFAWLAISRLDLSQDHDPSFVVMDEVCGVLLIFLGIPLSWQSAAAGFVLFRLLDVIKPYPARALEKMPGYWGIMLDDLMAAFYGWIILFLIFR